MSSAKIQPNKPFLLFLFGFPGSGKTAFSRELSDAVNAAHLQQDSICKQLFGGHGPNQDKASRKTLDYMTREFLKSGVSVVYDADAYRRAERRNIIELAKSVKATPIFVWIQIDADTAFARTQQRDRRKTDDHYAKPVTTDSFSQTLNKMQNPSNHEEYVVISGKHTFQTQKSAVFKRFYDLGVLTPAQLSKNVAKPELINLISKNSFRRGTDITRRNINIRQ